MSKKSWVVVFGALVLAALGSFRAYSQQGHVFSQNPKAYGIMSGVQRIAVGSASANSIWPLQVSGAYTASGGFARAVGVDTTLVASANSDVLSGLRINPTFTPGSFSGVSQVGLAVIAGNTGLGVGTPTEKLEVNGGVRLNTVTARPTCAVGIRGDMWVVQGATGVTDTLAVCLKSAANAYAWISIVTGG